MIYLWIIITDALSCIFYFFKAAGVSMYHVLLCFLHVYLLFVWFLPDEKQAHFPVKLKAMVIHVHCPFEKERSINVWGTFLNPVYHSQPVQEFSLHMHPWSGELTTWPLLFTGTLPGRVEPPAHILPQYQQDKQMKWQTTIALRRAHTSAKSY